MTDYREQVKQMLKDLAKKKEKDTEKPLPLMNQVLRTGFTRVLLLLWNHGREGVRLCL